MPDLLLATMRAAHFLACLVLFGELAFARMVDRVHRPRVIAGCVVVALATALAWLALEAASMSGEPLVAATRAEVLGRVLLHTQFGVAWLARIVLLGLVALAMARAQAVALAAAAGMLVALAWMGHAGAAADGAQRAGELANDAAHLVAAGAWVGTLPALVAALRRHEVRASAIVVRRYSRLATLAVVVIVFTGIVNTRFRVGTLEALVHGDYGALLLAKLGLVVLMLVLAGGNRFVLTPRLVAGDARAARALRRNAAAEIVLGWLVVAIVGLLGITAPAMTVMPGMAH